MEMTTKPSKEIQGEKQERARKVFISPVVPRFMSLRIGSLKWIAEFQEIPGKAVCPTSSSWPQNHNHIHQ